MAKTVLIAFVLALSALVDGRPAAAQDVNDIQAIQTKWRVVSAYVRGKQYDPIDVAKWKWDWEFDRGGEVAWYGSQPTSGVPLGLDPRSLPTNYTIPKRDDRALEEHPGDIELTSKAALGSGTFKGVFSFNEKRTKLTIGLRLEESAARPSRLTSDLNGYLVLDLEPAQ